MYSIIIPLFNKEKSISNTVNSVLRQTYTDFELLIINDGSTDKSLEIINKITDHRIRIINQLNAGESSARNTGIKIAKNEYIALLDADDYWDDKYLEIMKKLVNDFPEASIYGCQLYCVNKNNREIINKLHSKRGIVENYFKDQITAPLVTSSSVIVKKECFDGIGYFNTKLKRGGDLEMWVRLAKNFKIAFEPTPISYYVLDAENRACHNSPPLENFYLEDNFELKPYWERKYFIKFILLLLSE